MAFLTNSLCAVAILFFPLAPAIAAMDPAAFCGKAPVSLRNVLPLSVVHLPVDDPDVRAHIVAAVEGERRGATLPKDPNGRPAIHRERMMFAWEAANPDSSTRDTLRAIEASLSKIPLSRAVLEAKDERARANAIAALLQTHATATGIQHYDERGYLRASLKLREGLSVRDYLALLSQQNAGGVYFDPFTGNLSFCGTGRFVVF